MTRWKVWEVVCRSETSGDVVVETTHFFRRLAEIRARRASQGRTADEGRRWVRRRPPP